MKQRECCDIDPRDCTIYPFCAKGIATVTAAKETLVSEDRMRLLAQQAMVELREIRFEPILAAIRTAAREAGEAAAKVADARVAECGHDPWTAEAKAEARSIAAAIRERLP